MLMAVVTLLVTAAVLALVPVLSGRCYLTLTDADSGQVYGSYRLRAGEGFSVEFIHSVNRSPVRDCYEVRADLSIYVTQTIYYGFGAGVQTQLEPGQTLTYEDGAMVVSGIDTRIPSLRYIVGTVSDHVLRVDGQEISLRDLCGRNAHVVFSVTRSNASQTKEGSILVQIRKET